jgi:1-acyl-sn-glycerol-3-phosphate acyltransferase
MRFAHWAVTAIIGRLVRILCRVDAQQLDQVPRQGPLILTANHVNFLEAPVLYTHLHPRPMTAFVKVETWKSPVLGPLASLWGAIPIERGEADLTALRAGLQALEEGQILGVAPEGTRSGDGRLQRGHPGIVLLALRSNAPLLPLVTYGGELFWSNLPHLRRTDFHVAVGRPFTLSANGTKVTREVRQQMADEIMYQMAALLPPAYRGVYADMDGATETYLRFPLGGESNRNRSQSWESTEKPLTAPTAG